MKRFTLITLFLTLAAGTTLAQPRPGSIGLFADTEGLDCNIHDTVPGLLSMYVVHTLGQEVASSMWMVEPPPCNTMTYLSDTAIFPVTTGFSYSGISVAYGACLTSPVHILTINWFASGTTPQCCVFTVVASPASTYGEIEAADCDFNRMFPTGRDAVVNPTVDCSCWASPVQETTWGQVKALYQ